MMRLLGRHAPDDLVCFGTGGERTAAQLAAFARSIARALPDAGPGARVVLACGDRYRFSAALAASWLRGYVAVLPPNGQPATVHALVESERAVALLHDRDEQQGLDVRTLESHDARDELPIELALQPHDIAVVAYTSGSTGVPMAHPKALVQLLREPEAHVVGFDLARRRVVAAVPPYHIYGLLFGVLVPLLGGGSTSRNAPLLPAELLREIESGHADVLIAVPPHLRALAELQREAWPRLHRVFSSAAPLPAQVSDALRGRGVVVTEVLGSTETGGIAFREAASAPWTPLPSVRTAIADDGLLSVDSPWLAPQAERPLATADRVEAVPGGFRHLGRSDAVVKVGGRRIDTGDVEARIKAYPGVRDARVLSVASSNVRGVELLAVVEADALDLANLKRALAVHIDPVAVPRRFRVVAQLPRSETGKLTRAALLALFDVWEFPREHESNGRIRIRVPENCGYFRGHFDGLPILPGVVQLSEFALREARQRFPGLGPLSRVSRVKFKRLVAPNDELELALEAKGPNVVQFALTVQGEPAAAGLLHFAPEASAS
jgi:acyl-coenzyme A synthetase/AMP-(fatty) acid ligase